MLDEPKTKLVNQANSVMERLQEIPSTQNTFADFPWQSMAREVQPGTDTPMQRAQMTRLVAIRSHLHDWLEKWNVPTWHEEASAFFAVVSTSPEADQRQTQIVASVIAWIYTFDTYFDHQDWKAQDLHHLERRVTRGMFVMLEPLSQSRNSPRHDTDPIWEDVHTASLALALYNALSDIVKQIEEAPFAHFTDNERQLVAKSFMRFALAMRQEFLWSMALSKPSPLYRYPSIKRYLEYGKWSIGIFPIASITATFDIDNPDQLWRQAAAVIEAAGRIIRLSNDIHTYPEDLLEGKLTAITLALLNERIAPANALPSDTLQAQRMVTQILNQALLDFVHRQPALPDGPLGYFVRYATAFTLIVYGAGVA
jgi:Terpene synthase family 2, C-terminal metal binding